MADQTIPLMARCRTCHHPRSMHSGGLQCRARYCTAGPDGTRCPAFEAVPDQPTITALPEPAQMAAALETVLAAVEHSAGTATGHRGAVALNSLLDAIRPLRAAAPPEVIDRLQTCLTPPAQPESAEVTDARAPRRKPRKPRQD